jgi:hypothetical protein
MSLRIVGLVVGVLLLAAGAAAIYYSTRNYALDAYNSAPNCASLDDAAAGKDCRFMETATITSGTGTSDIYFAFPGPYVPYGHARLPDGVIVKHIEGDRVAVEVWGYRVTKIAGVATADNPANDSRLADLRATGVVLAVIGFGAIVLALLPWRRDTPSAGISPIAVSDALWRTL